MEKEIEKLHPNEEFIITRWRNKYRFGRITIVMQDGIPQYIEKVIIKDFPKDFPSKK